MDSGLLVISIVGGLLGPLFIATFTMLLETDKEEILTAILFVLYVISAAILIPVNLYQTTEYKFYVIDYNYDMQCEFYQLMDENSKIRNYLDVKEIYKEPYYASISKVVMSTRVHDKEAIRDARKEFDFPTFNHKEDALKYLCDQKGDEYTFTFDNKCLKCE